MAFVAILVLGSIVTMALLADAIATHDPVAQDVARRLRPPGPDGYFGTDGFGRDVFSRVVHGSRASLYVGLLSVGIASVAGIGLGTLSAYWSGPFDLVVQRAVDTLLGFPLLVLAIVMVVALGPSANSVVVAIALALAPQIARLSRASALYVKEELYMDAARVIGAPPHRVISETPAAQQLPAGIGAGDGVLRGRGRRRDRPELPGPGRASALPVMGKDAARGVAPVL